MTAYVAAHKDDERAQYERAIKAELASLNARLASSSSGGGGSASATGQRTPRNNDAKLIDVSDDDADHSDKMRDAVDDDAIVDLSMARDLCEFALYLEDRAHRYDAEVSRECCCCRAMH
jgi:hypothetical protein